MCWALGTQRWTRRDNGCGIREGNLIPSTFGQEGRLLIDTGSETGKARKQVCRVSLEDQRKTEAGAPGWEILLSGQSQCRAVQLRLAKWGRRVQLKWPLQEFNKDGSVYRDSCLLENMASFLSFETFDVGHLTPSSQPTLQRAHVPGSILWKSQAVNGVVLIRQTGGASNACPHLQFSVSLICQKKPLCVKLYPGRWERLPGLPHTRHLKYQAVAKYPTHVLKVGIMGLIPILQIGKLRFWKNNTVTQWSHSW